MVRSPDSVDVCSRKPEGRSGTKARTALAIWTHASQFATST